MELNIITIALLIIIGAILIFRKPKAVEPQDNGTMQLMMNQINELSRTVDTKLSESSKNLQDTFLTQSNSSFKMIRDITEELTSLKETNKQVMSFTEQLQSLQDILKNPKQRGVLGEYYLETLLKNVLSPGSYEMQYMFTDGSIVDAIVRVKDKIIPIDSKFSLENYNKLVEEQNPAEKERLEKTFVNDLKMRITETSKYIKPSENTMDFAFMFIPHEAIYYDLLVNKIGALKDENENLIQRAASRYKVIIVSPTSFLAYLQTVLQGLNALRIEETAKDIVKRVEELGKHLKVYEESYNKIGTSLQTTFNHFNKSSAELKKIDKDIMRITESAPGIEALVLDKPEIEE